MDDPVPPYVSVSFYPSRTVCAASLPPMKMIYFLKSAHPGDRWQQPPLRSRFFRGGNPHFLLVGQSLCTRSSRNGFKMATNDVDRNS